MSQKRKLNSYTLGLKQKIISDYDNGMRNKAISEKYNIHHSTISNIIQNRKQITSIDENLSKKKRLRTVKYPEVEEHLVNYLSSCRNSNIPVSGTLIQQAAKDFAQVKGEFYRFFSQFILTVLSLLYRNSRFQSK